MNGTDVAHPPHYLLTLPGIPKSLWSYAIGTEPQTIGRGKKCAIRVGDRSVSREHAIIWQQDGQVHLRDLCSANGTSVNGVNISEAVLSHNDLIQVGQLVLQVRGCDETTLDDEFNASASEVDTTVVTGNAAVLAAARLPRSMLGGPGVREDIAALYSLGGSLGLCGDRGEVLRHMLDWLREWVSADYAGALFQQAGTWRLVAATAKEAPGEVEWSLVNECLDHRDLQVRPFPAAADSATPTRRVLAAYIPGVSPAGVLYGEWHRGDPSAIECRAELIRAATEVLGDALARLKTVRRTAARRLALSAGGPIDEQIVGGPAIDPVREFIDRAAAVDATVLITGETGTGKELVAQAIHCRSRRGGGPFVARNCGAFPESLLESELFGYEPGAFTGATKLRKGVFDQAHGGTLLLDEIGETPPALQSKLLRVLEVHEFHRVGGQQSVRVDVRIIAATNCELAQAVTDREFRRDLYYRLQVLAIHLPPLRDRPGDVRRLADHFIQLARLRMNLPEIKLSPDALQKLEMHDWPGNIRELRNTIDRAVIFSQGKRIEEAHIAITHGPRASSIQLPTVKLQDLEREHILQVMQRVGGNKVKAAAILGIDRTTLHRKLRRYAPHLGESASTE
jgi:DNA-binding NtrC family response regulator